MRKFSLLLTMLFGLSISAQAAVIAFDDLELSAGASVTKDGLTVNTTTDTGSISSINSGDFAGLWLGNISIPDHTLLCVEDIYISCFCS